MRRSVWLAATLASLLAAPLAAEVSPTPGPGDPHIQTVVYDADQVVALRVAQGYALTILFSADERIETVTVGDSTSWQVQANRSADRLVIHPTGGGSTTNLTVITDIRPYNFTLYGGSPGDPSSPYTLSFTYPPPATPPGPPVPTEQAHYHMRGSRSLWPSTMYDDGAATSIIWPLGVTLPAIYQIDGSGKEALVNGLMRDGAYVVEGVHQRLLFKSGRTKATATRVDPLARRAK